MPRKFPYLQRRGDIFSSRIATLELQAVAGKREFTKTPETGDKSVVITKALMLVAELKQPVVS
jgi:hypothetical protein